MSRLYLSFMPSTSRAPFCTSRVPPSWPAPLGPLLHIPGPPFMPSTSPGPICCDRLASNILEGAPSGLRCPVPVPSFHCSPPSVSLPGSPLVGARTPLLRLSGYTCHRVESPLGIYLPPCGIADGCSGDSCRRGGLEVTLLVCPLQHPPCWCWFAGVPGSESTLPLTEGGL